MLVVIVANAPDCNVEPFRDLIARATTLIAADGGGNTLYAAGFVPQLVIGDLDSLSPTAAAAFSAAGVDFERYPPAKDETDLELALLRAIDLGASEIVVLGALGGRWDQTLSNVALLALPELAACTVRLRDGDQEVFLVRECATIHGQIGETVSLLPLGGHAHGISTRGLLYPLTDATLRFERSRGVSNEIIATPAEVCLREGLLIVTHTFQ